MAGSITGTSRETVISGGSILTMDPAQPRAEALLLRGNRIAAVGTNAAVRGEARVGAQWLDLHGRTVVPGFADSHLHLAALGARDRAVSLAGLSKPEILEVLRDHEKQLKTNETLIAYDWDFPSCPDPHRRDLDAAFPDRPVILFQFSGHGAWVNTEGLALLGVTEKKSSWGVGGADRDEGGKHTGVLREPAQAPRAKRVYLKQDLNFARIREDVAHAMNRLAAVGVTTAHDNTWFPWILSIIQRLHRTGTQKVRLSCWSPGFLPPIDILFSLKRFDADWYRFGPRKYFIDGAFSSHSAWLTEPYADQPENSGQGLPSARLATILRRANRRERQIACHSIGDAATAAFLDAVESVGVEISRPLRHRIEHGQLIRPEDFRRIADSGVIVSAQPHAACDPEKDTALLGDTRAGRAYPYRSLIDAGIHVAFGSDYPGEQSFAPLEGIHHAVNRAGDEAISPEEALECYTAGGAYAEFREGDKGRIRSGYLADLAILSDDPTEVDPRRIRAITVDFTVVDGDVVFARQGLSLDEVRPETASVSAPGGR